MASRTSLRTLVAVAAMSVTASAFGQAGLKVPERGEPGLDPAFARGWLAPDYERFGFANFHWRDAAGFAPSQRMHWSYSFSERSSLGMSFGNSRDYEPDQRQLSVFGRYSLSTNWALSAGAVSREPGDLLRLQDFRIGVHRRF